MVVGRSNDPIVAAAPVVVVAAAVGGDDDDGGDAHQLLYHLQQHLAVDSNVKEDGHCSKTDGGQRERSPSS